ncbi:MAG: T9SS type A sorting domain-containing protein [Fibrobacteres bacterium]|nr:T9SS type A sorting domain-containing protein [Fibrobacterota bacterium]
MKIKTSVLLLLAAFSLLYSLTAKNIYLTTNTLLNGTSVRPGYNFKFVWNGIGQGNDGSIYMTISDRSEEQGGGDVCVTEYNPYTNVMRSLGTVTEAYKRANNCIDTEYCNKVHTWLSTAADGKVWFGSQDGGRGSHLLYIDPLTKTVVDYSKGQKYLFRKSTPMVPYLNLPLLSPSDTSGVAIQNCSFTNMNINPFAPNRMWTNSYTNNYFHCWDVLNDTARSFPGGNADMRVFLVDKKGDLFASLDGMVLKRSFSGSAKIIARNVSPNQPSTFVYTRSFDSAFTSNRGTGNIELYDFTKDTVYPIADLPDGYQDNKEYRAMTISKDGKSLYILGNSGIVYQLNIQTRQYQNVGNISSYLADSYAFSNGINDTNGNWYICTWGGGRSYWVQVNLGKDAVTPAVEQAASTTQQRSLSVFPNPFRTYTTLQLSLPGGITGGRVDFTIFDHQGRLIHRISSAVNNRRVILTKIDLNSFPAGVYSIMAKCNGAAWTSKILSVR